MEHWWNHTYNRKLKYSKKNFSQLHFVHQKSYLKWLGIEPGPLWWQVKQLAARAMAQRKCNAVVAVQGKRKQLLQVYICGYNKSK